MGEAAAQRAWAAAGAQAEALQASRRPAAEREAAAALQVFAPAAVLPASEELRAAEAPGPLLQAPARAWAPAAAERAQGKAASASGAEPGAAAGRPDLKLLVRPAVAGEAAAQQASWARARRGRAAD